MSVSGLLLWERVTAMACKELSVDYLRPGRAKGTAGIVAAVVSCPLNNLKMPWIRERSFVRQVTVYCKKFAAFISKLQ